MTEVGKSVESQSQSRSNASVNFGAMFFLGLMVIGSCAILTWKTQELIRSENLSLLAETTEQKLVPVREHLLSGLDNVKMAMVNVANRHETGGGSTASESKEVKDTSFELVTLLKAKSNTNATSENSVKREDTPLSAELVPKWMERAKKGPLASWPQGYEQTLLKSLSLQNIKDGQLMVYRLAHPDGLPLWAVALSVDIDRTGEVSSQLETSSRQRGYLVAFMQTSPIVSFIEHAAGPQQQVYVIDDKGYVAAHSKPVYLGALFTEDPMVKEALLAKQNSHNAQYEDLESQVVLGRFERLNGSNLTLIHTSPASQAEILPRAQLRLSLVIGAQALFLTLILGFFFLRRQAVTIVSEPTLAAPALPVKNAGAWVQPPEQAVKEAARAILPPPIVQEAHSIAPSVRMAWMSNMEFEETKGREMRAEALKQTGQGVAHALREPIQAILGNAQMASSKTQDSNLLLHTAVIEREARSMRSMLENLEKMAVAKTNSLEPYSLRAILLEVLEVHQPLIRSLNVRLEHDLGDVPKIPADPKKLRDAFQVLFEHSLQSMRDIDQAKLYLSLKQVAGFVLFELKDFGVGMTELEKQFIGDPFSPFAQNKAGGKAGLNLAFAMDVFKAHGANLEIQSEKGQGATYQIRFSPALVGMSPSLSGVNPAILSVTQTLEASPSVDLSPSAVGVARALSSTQDLRPMPSAGKPAPLKTKTVDAEPRFEIGDEDIMIDFSQLSVLESAPNGGTFVSGKMNSGKLDVSDDDESDDHAVEDTLAFLDQHQWSAGLNSDEQIDINADVEESFASMSLNSSSLNSNDLISTDLKSTKLRKPRLKG